MELTIMNGYLPVIELFIVLIPWEKPIILLFGLSEEIYLRIWYHMP